MLYRLYINQFKILGYNGQRQVILINGPYDKYGYILSGPDSKGIYQIRGTGKEKPYYL